MVDSSQQAPDFPGQIKHVDDSPNLSRSHYHSFIADFMGVLHSTIPPLPPPELHQPARVEFRQEYFRGRSVTRAVMFLLTNGCEWALRSAHGCTMCGHIAKQSRADQPFPAEHFIDQFAPAFASLDFDEIPVLNIFNNGSFFNDNEIPPDARRTILTMISKTPSIKKLLLESRPEFITESVLRETKAILGETELEIAIGLETADDFKRAVAINKGFTLRDFERAAKMIKSEDIGLRSYVLIKPPFCSEADAIEDAVRTVETAFSLGVDSVSLEGMTVQKHTLVEYLYKHDLYRLPWLWSIIEIVKRTAHLGKVVVGLFSFYPSPDLVPTNCDLCNERVFDTLVRYNNTCDVEVFRDLGCPCQAEWAEVLKDTRDTSQFLRELVETASAEASPAG
jgi:archaeosine synthase beta-subunit